jgi:hypothetical protein
MKKVLCNSEGVSEVAAEILIIFLIILLAGVAYVVFSGWFPLLQKTSLVAASAGVAYVPIDTTTAFPVFYVLPQAGEQFYLTGQSNIPDGAPSASFLLIAPDGSSSRTSLADVSGSGNLYGKPLYLYQDIRGGGFWVTDNMQTTNKNKYLIPLKGGNWMVKMIDDTANVVLMESTVSITGNGSLSNPLSPSTIWTNSTGQLSLTNSSGYAIPFTNNGTIPFIGPNGLPAFQFNGTGAYIQGADNPGLEFTGDMSLSLWLDPADASGPLSGSGSNWHTVVGKGLLTGGSNEIDNYQLVQMGNQMYFEWNDVGTGLHYNIVTNSIPNMQNNWNYITVTIPNGGLPSIYVNGVSQFYNVYQSNTPGVNYIGSSSSPPAGYGVQLQNVGNNILIGKQNGPPGDEFYYTGSMSQVSFYNTVLTPSQIIANNNTYQT